MRCTILILAAALCIALVTSHPLPEEERLQSEALDRLVMVEADNETALRSKRTIGILRELFPEISQMIEQKVNGIIAQILRVLGPVLVRNFLGNNQGGGDGSDAKSNNDDGSTVTLASPFGDEDEDGFKSTSSNGSKVSISLPTFPPDSEEETDRPSDSSISSSTLSTMSAAEATILMETRSGSKTDVASETTGATTTDVNPEAEDRVNEVAESQNNEVRVQFADEQSNDATAPDLTPLDEVETTDDENRNKRFLNFGFGGGAGGGSGAGSGNFLFDIIRQAADGAARAAGTVYRVVAGTQSLGLGLSASRDLVPQDAAPAAAPGSSTTGGFPMTAQAASGAGNLPPLVAGSGSQGNSSGAAAGKADGVQEAIPGPVTRLFVIANRGISNLIQDLILRLAATSERIVNFKARLITSII